MRVAIYARVSTDEQAERYGLTSQVSELRALVQQRGWTVVAELVDDGYSGATLERPALTRLRDGARAGAFDVVLAHDPDRLSRRLAHQLLLVEELERAARVEFLTTPREDTAEGRLLLQVKGIVAEYEREKIRERTNRGKREKARRGLAVAGPVPYGYRLDPDGHLLVHEEEAATIRMFYRWLVEEQRSTRSIALEARRLGLRAPRGGPWQRSSMTKLLRAELYGGQAFYNRRDTTSVPGRTVWRQPEEWIGIAVPALVPETLWHAAQRQLGVNRTRLAGRPAGHIYLLSGLLRCGACGRRMAADPDHGRRAYRCAGRDRLTVGTRCTRRLRAAEAERAIWSAIAALLRHPELLLGRATARQRRLGRASVEIRSEVEQLARQLAEQRRVEGRLLDLYAHDDVITVDDLRARLAEARAARLAAEERLHLAQARLDAVASEAARRTAVRAACATARYGLEGLDRAGQQQALRRLVDMITVQSDHFEVRGALDLPSPEETAHNLTGLGAVAAFALTVPARPRRSKGTR